MEQLDRQDLTASPSIWQSGWFNTLSRFAALIAIFVFFTALIGEDFYSDMNLENIARQSAVYATAGVGMTFVIISAGIDLSVGSVIALALVMVAYALNLHTTTVVDGKETAAYLINDHPTLVPILAVLAAVLAATLAGAINGLLIVGLRLVPFIVTLGTMMIFRGAAKGVAEEKYITPVADTWVDTIMDPTLVSPDPARNWLILPPGVWIMVVSAIVAALLLRYTRLGRHIFAVGSNQETARLCGVHVGRTKIVVYMLAGFFAGLAGLMQFSYGGGIGEPTAAISYELYVIAAVVIGGGSFLGGEGSVLGTVIGAFIIAILYMGGQQMDWPKFVQEIVIGSIIIIAVALDRLRHAKTG